MNALIIEDEALSRAALSRSVKNEFPDITIVGMTGSVEESVAFISGHPELDIIFMDVELSDGDCFEIFHRVKIEAKVIMTTAYDNYAVKAFEAGSIDYLLKPIDREALRRAVGRCRKLSENDIRNLIDAISAPASRTGQGSRQRIIVRLNDRIIPVRTDDVAYIYSEDKENYLITKDNSRFIIDSSLDEICTSLPKERFFKISRRCVVSLEAIGTINKLSGGRLQITARPHPPFDMIVSRLRSDEFLSWLEG